MHQTSLTKSVLLDNKKLLTYAVGFSVVMALTELSSHASQIDKLHGSWPSFTEFVFNTLMCSALMLIGIVAVASLRMANWLKLGAVALLAAAITAWLDYALLTQWLKLPSWWMLQQKRTDLHWIQPLLVFFHLLASSGLVLFVYNYREHHLRSQISLQNIQARQADASRKLLQARLQVMQAQVEPEFLLSTLAQVEQLYERDRERADKVMDELISYLRAAIPRMRSSSSTLGLERGLVLAYLQLHIEPNGGLNQVSFELEAHDADIEFPSMVLMPLVSRCVQGSSHITIAVKKSAADITIGIAIDAALTEGLHERLGLTETRERLTQLYGETARVAAMVMTAGTLSLRISVPNLTSISTA